jgi:glycosyltransferase involved in cell wall biosynthesis
MKFSVLLPTRNRLDLLRYAVESVRLQEYPDWEIIISDNASTEDVSSFAASYADKRIRYYRTERLLPVTENWNAALERATGDYLIMLGDDDGLMRNCLATAHKIIQEWNHPDAVYTQAWQFAYPGVIPSHPHGFVQVAYNAFLAGVERPILLSRQITLEMVRSAMNFRLWYGFNMQHFIISRKLVETLRPKGPFFQSPYPDYYAANTILLAAQSVVANPEPLVMIGISPKSFGYYYFNRREDEGVEFLQNLPSDDLRHRLRKVMVPGTNMNDSWLCAMETLRQNFPEHTGLRVNHRRYRLLQYYALWRNRSWRGIPIILRHMRLWEIALYAPVMFSYACAYLLPSTLRHSVQRTLHGLLSASPPFDTQRTPVPYLNILEAVRNHGF